MALVCFASQKGSPGATAVSLAVAAAMRLPAGRRKLLLEADVSGGSLALRYGLPTEPGLVTLAAAIRAGIEPDGLWRHAQELPGGLSIVVCPDGPGQVHAALAASGARLGRFLGERADVDVICDVGRLAPGSPAEELVGQATALLMVARPAAEQLQPAARRMVGLRSEVRNLGWVLIGEEPYGPAEVEVTFGFPVVGVIADDRRSVAAMEQGAMSRRLRRHPFIRSASTLADILTDWLAPLTDPAPVDDPTDLDGPDANRAATRSAPDDLGSDGLGSDDLAPDDLAPYGLPPDGFAPDGLPPDDPAPVGLAPDDASRPDGPGPLFAVGPPTFGEVGRLPPEPIPSGRRPPLRSGYAWAPLPPLPPSPHRPRTGFQSGAEVEAGLDGDQVEGRES